MTMIIGVDCAADDAKVGLALGVFNKGRVQLCHAKLCGRNRSPASVVCNWLSHRDGAALIAIDAPLGWPKPLAEALIEHCAGDTLNTSANAMFSRTTDLFIQRKLEMRPLEVGANLIARTAHAALCLLGEVRDKLSLLIPLAWEPADVKVKKDVAAIEVYPAATLKAHCLPFKGYKKRDQLKERRKIVTALRQRLTIQTTVRGLAQSADLVDAAVCLVAGDDFLQGRAMRPEDHALAQREGWIWASGPEA